jgi:hypothetical protein
VEKDKATTILQFQKWLNLAWQAYHKAKEMLS